MKRWGEEFIHIEAVRQCLLRSNVVGFWGNFLVNLSQRYPLENTEVVNGKKNNKKKNNDQLLPVMR